MRTAGAAATVRRRRLEKVRRAIQPKHRVGRLMYLCTDCRRWTYNLSQHQCGRRMNYPGGFG